MELDQSQKNSQKFGKFVAEAMEGLEDDFPTGEVGTIALIVEIQNKRDDGTTYTTTRFLCNDARNFVQIGLLRSAQIVAEGGS